jgi:hypothetical protein
MKYFWHNSRSNILVEQYLKWHVLLFISSSCFLTSCGDRNDEPPAEASTNKLFESHKIDESEKSVFFFKQNLNKSFDVNKSRFVLAMPLWKNSNFQKSTK